MPRVPGFLALILSFTVSAAAQPPASAVHILVVEGEDAVNIVQQKTAVAPGPCTPSMTDTFGFGRAPVGGTTSSLTFTANPSNRFSGTGGSGTNAYTYVFNGALSGDQIVGTLSLTRTITNDAAPALPGVGSIVYNVTLR